MKIAFFDIKGWEEPLVRKAFPDAQLSFSTEKLTEETLPATRDFDIASIFVDSRITPGVLNALHNLKLVATRSTGFDHINIAACASHNVTVSYVPGYGNNTVAEFAFGLILNLTRKIYTAIDRVKETGTFSWEGLRGIDLKEKTIGVIGTGRIGKESISIAKGFGMNVIAYDPKPDTEAADRLKFTYGDLEPLLKQSDIITIHAPLTDTTRHLINRKNIKLIKRGAYLINTARGGIVETDALVSALRDGTLAGAGLDVLEEEGDIKDELAFLSGEHQSDDDIKTVLENHLLMHMPNVIITPHTAFNSQEALERILKTTTDSIAGFIAGTPTNVVPS